MLLKKMLTSTGLESKRQKSTKQKKTNILPSPLLFLKVVRNFWWGIGTITHVTLNHITTVTFLSQSSRVNNSGSVTTYRYCQSLQYTYTHGK